MSTTPSFFDDDSPISPISSTMSEPGFPGPTRATHQQPQPQRHSYYQAMEVIRSDIDPEVHTLYEQSTGTYQYIVADPTTGDAVIIDPVLDRNPHTPGINTTAADRILHVVHQYQYNVVRILATHSMPEHPTSAWYLRTQLRDREGHMPRICTGKAISSLQRVFAKQYGVQDAGWASRFDAFRDGQVFVIGNMKAQVIHLLSQPDWFGFVIGKHVFLGREMSNDDIKSPRPTLQVPLRKLATFRADHTFHPETSGELSRPGTSQTDISTWMHEPLDVTSHLPPDTAQAPQASRASTGISRMLRMPYSNRTASPTTSRTSSRTSSRRISQIPELA